MDIRLSFAMSPYDRVLPLINGEVRPDGITLDYQGLPGGFSRVFYEQMKFQRYDLSEMSMSTFLRQRSIGWPYRMLPIFHNRNFSFTSIRIRRNAGIRQGHPEDLKGKRFGIADYQQTWGLWVRGILDTEFGVKPEDMVWYQERGEHLSLTGASEESGLKLPSNIKLNYAKKDFGTMFREGELDATASPGGHEKGRDAGLNRQPADSGNNPDIIPLFPDARQESIRFFKKTGVYPPHHVTVIREEIINNHPWMAMSLMGAFEEAKRVAMERLRQSPPTLMVFGPQYVRELDAIFGPDPYPYGLKANAKTFDMAQTFSAEQGLTPRKQPLDEIVPKEIIIGEERL